MTDFFLYPPRWNEQTRQKIAETAYLVFADSDQVMAIWSEFAPRFGSYTQDMAGWCATIGDDKNKPVILGFQWYVANGVRIGFWEFYGIASNQEMAEQWFDTHMWGVPRFAAEEFGKIFEFITQPSPDSPHLQPKKEKPVVVKVISKKPVVTKKVVCPHCGHRLSYTQNDVHRYDGTDISGGPDGQEWIVCPNDGKEVILRSW
jgi:hypothetical protein